MTSAFAVGVTAMCVAIAFLTGLALWWAFQDYRAGAAERAVRAVRIAEQRHRARHDGRQAAARADYNQVAVKHLNTPTGALDPYQIARLMETTR